MQRILQDILSIELSCFIFGGGKTMSLHCPLLNPRAQWAMIPWVTVCSSIVTKHYIERLPKVTKLLVSATFWGEIELKHFLMVLLFFIFNVYSWDRHSMSGGGAERGRHRIWSRLSTQSPTWDLNSWTVRSWPDSESEAQLTEPPRRPCFQFSYVSVLRLFLDLELRFAKPSPSLCYGSFSSMRPR